VLKKIRKTTKKDAGKAAATKPADLKQLQIQMFEQDKKRQEDFQTIIQAKFDPFAILGKVPVEGEPEKKDVSIYLLILVLVYL